MQTWLAMAAAVNGTSLSTLFSGRSSSNATEPLAPPLRPLTSKVPASWKARRSRTGACRQRVLTKNADAPAWAINCKECLRGYSRLSGSQPAQSTQAELVSLQAVPPHYALCCTDAVNQSRPCGLPCSSTASTLGDSTCCAWAPTKAASHLALVDDFAECPVHSLPGSWLKGDRPACGTSASFLAACTQLRHPWPGCTSLSCRPDRPHR